MRDNLPYPSTRFGKRRGETLLKRHVKESIGMMGEVAVTDAILNGPRE